MKCWRLGEEAFSQSFAFFIVEASCFKVSVARESLAPSIKGAFSDDVRVRERCLPGHQGYESAERIGALWDCPSGCVFAGRTSIAD
jgi:hypothetical protein